VECQVYYNVLMNTKSQVDFDCLLQLHMLDQTEEDNHMSWKCCKVDDYCKEKGDVNISKYKYLLEWNEINKTKSNVWWNGMMSIRLNHG
jgi:hypothetical protein